MHKLILALLLLIPLVACNSVTPSKEAKVPAWVLNPPGDSREWLWGVGEGLDLDTAKRAGLKDIASKLRVSISGQLESSVTVDNDKVDRQARTRISEEVQKTEFINYLVDKTNHSGDSFYVLIKVDRPGFVRDTRARLDNIEAAVQPVAASLGDKTPLERFIVLRRLQPSLDKGIGYAQVLMGADPGGNGATRLRTYEDLQRKARQAVSALVFQVQSRSEDGDLATAVTTFLNENGIRADSARSPGSNALAVSSSSRSDSLYGSKITQLTVTLRVSDDQGRTLASRDFKVSGTSSYDLRGARQNAIQKLVVAMREAGAVASLGFNE